MTPRTDRIPDGLFKAIPTIWRNPALRPSQRALRELAISPRDFEDAAARWQRLHLQLPALFPNELGPAGKIESEFRELKSLPELQPHRVFVKCDHDLPITGCVKARGAFYEMFLLAENIAVDAGLATSEGSFDVQQCKELFSKYTVVVGSTGNLGYSVGLIARALGFACEVHMSSEAKQWKKDRLRNIGAIVVEHATDYSSAVAAARSTVLDTFRYFVDDEDSLPLFLGYALSAIELRAQFAASKFMPKKERPLYIVVPCGVGGAPAGITYGSKLVFGDAVRSVFVEPVQAPAMFLQLLVGIDRPISAYDIGLTNRTEADGLAVAAASLFAAAQVQHLVEYCATVQDSDLEIWTKRLWQSDGLRLELSAAAGFAGIEMINKMLMAVGPQHNEWDFLIWTTGGTHLPDAEHDAIMRGHASPRDEVA